MKKSFYREDVEKMFELMNESCINEDKNPCWDGYKQIGMKEKDGKEVPNCVPNEDEEDYLNDDIDQMDTVIEIQSDVPIEPEYDHHNEVLVSDLKKLSEYSRRLEDLVNSDVEFDDWMVAKITKASDYVSDIWHRIDAKVDFANSGMDNFSDDEF